MTGDIRSHTPPSNGANALLASEGESTGVQLRGVVKDYGATRVLHGVDLDVAPGEFVSLLGPSGCGKTTALRVLAGLERASGGEVRIGGRDVSGVPTNKRDIGMVFQSYSLFPHLKVRDNTAFGLRRRGVGSAEARRRAGDALDLVGLGHLADRYAHQLSGGQQQRVALARAIVTEPRVLLLDEPLSALDAKVRVQLRDEIRRIQLRLGTTTVFVTHDQEEALAVSDRVAVMGGGRILQIGSPEDLYVRPGTAEVAAFVGTSSLIPGVVSGATVEAWGRRLPLLSPVPDGPCEVFVRPENVQILDEGEDGIDATVETTTFLGSVRRSTLRAADGRMVHVQHAADTHLVPGDSVRVRIDDIPVLARVSEETSAR